MITNIYTHEVRLKLRSVLIWSLSIAALIFFFFSIYQSFASQAELTSKLMEKFPQELKVAFGLNHLDMATVLGFFSLIYTFTMLCAAIQAGNFGFGLVSIEESELTADFLLTKPVSRVRILTSKLLAALTAMIITNLAISLATVLAITINKGDRTYDAATLALMLVGLLLFQIFFLCVGLVISLLVKRIHNVTPYSLGLAFGAYVLNAFSGIFGDVKLEYITPFRHFDPYYILEHKAFDTRLLILNICISVVAVAVSYWLYIRRDIHAVS
jgi:ABC-2 type transport system permease protein